MDERLWRCRNWLAPTRNNNGVRVLQLTQTSLWRNGDPARCANSTIFQSADREGIPSVEFWTWQPKHLDYDAELKGAQAVISQRDDSVLWGGSFFCGLSDWHIFDDNRLLGHWQAGLPLFDTWAIGGSAKLFLLIGGIHESGTNLVRTQV
jgi:hypothetical protein